MKRSGYLKTGLAMVAVAGMMSAITPQKAAAQGIFSSIFGGGGGGGWQSGRQEIPFRAKYGRGTIIVSFADRRLYYVHKKGAALSYPIGVPSGRIDSVATSAATNTTASGRAGRSSASRWVDHSAAATWLMRARVLDAVVFIGRSLLLGARRGTRQCW